MTKRDHSVSSPTLKKKGVSAEVYIKKFKLFLQSSSRFKSVNTEDTTEELFIETEPSFEGVPTLIFTYDKIMKRLFLQIEGSNFFFTLKESLNFLISLNLRVFEASFFQKKSKNPMIHLERVPGEKKKISSVFLQQIREKNLVSTAGRTVLELRPIKIVKKTSEPKKIPSNDENTKKYSRFSRPSVVHVREKRYTQLEKRKVVEPQKVSLPAKTVQAATVSKKPLKEKQKAPAKTIATSKVVQSPTSKAKTKAKIPIKQDSRVPFFSTTSQEGKELTEEESIVIKEIMSRPKHKVQSNLLVKTTGFDQERIRGILRILVSKGVLRVASGWYILRNRKAYRPIQEQFETVKMKSEEKSVTKDTDAGVARKKLLAGLDNKEQLIMNAILDRPKRKVQSNLLRKITRLDQDGIREILKQLVHKNYLTVQSGWYCADVQSIRELAVHQAIAELPVDEEIGRSDISLSHQEKEVLSLILNRKNRKAQSNILKKSMKLDQDSIRSTLKNLVNKEYLVVSSGWYVIKEERIPEIMNILNESKPPVKETEFVQLSTVESSFITLEKGLKAPSLQMILSNQPSLHKEMFKPKKKDKISLEEHLWYLYLREKVFRKKVLERLQKIPRERKSKIIVTPIEITASEKKKLTVIRSKYKSFDDEVNKAWIMFEDFLEDHKVIPIYLNQSIYSKKNNYADVTDFIGEIDGRTSLMLFNLAIGAVQDKERLRGSAAKRAAVECLKTKIDRVTILQFPVKPGYLSPEIESENMYQFTVFRKDSFEEFRQVLKKVSKDALTQLKAPQLPKGYKPKIDVAIKNGIEIQREEKDIGEVGESLITFHSQVGKINYKNRNNELYLEADLFPANSFPSLNIMFKATNLQSYLSGFHKLIKKYDIDPKERVMYLRIREKYIRWKCQMLIAEKFDLPLPDLIFYESEKFQNKFEMLSKYDEVFQEEGERALTIFESFLNENSLKPIQLNTLLISLEYNFGVIVDFLGEINGQLTAINITTDGGIIQNRDRVYGAGIKQALLETFNLDLDKIYILQICPDVSYLGKTINPDLKYQVTQLRKEKSSEFNDIINDFLYEKDRKRDLGDMITWKIF